MDEHLDWLEKELAITYTQIAGSCGALSDKIRTEQSKE